MVYITIVKGRKINKLLCFICLVPAVILLAAAGILALTSKEALAETFLIIGAITGGFALLYGILWLFFALREGKQQRQLENMPVIDGGSSEPVFTSKEYILPKEKLTLAARRRFIKIVIGCCIAALLTGAGILLMLFVRKSIEKPVQILYAFVFGVVIVLPGIIIQAVLYFRYASSVPEKIILFPGKLVIDHTVYSGPLIRNIRISSNRLLNPNSPAVYREMEVNLAEGSHIYRIDYRVRGNSSEQPEWAEYSRFISHLCEWGKENRIDVTIDYMN